MDEYYFWLIDTQVYTNPADTDSPTTGDASFTGSYQFGFQDSYYDQFQQQSAEWNDEDQVPPLLATWQPRPGRPPGLVPRAQRRVRPAPALARNTSRSATPPDLVFLGRAWDSLYFEVTGGSHRLAPATVPA